MRKFTGSKFDIKGLLRSAVEDEFMPPRKSSALQADEVTAYILGMVVELAAMADDIKDRKLAERLRSVARPSMLEALCPSDLSNR